MTGIRGAMTGGNNGQAAISNTITCTLPGGCVVGDVAIFAVTSNISTSAMLTPPAGWTALYAGGGPIAISNVGNAWAWRKTLTAGDIAAGTVSAVLTANQKCTGAGIVLSGSNGVEGSNGASNQSSGTSHPLSAYTTTHSSDYLVGICHFRQGTAPFGGLTWPAGWTEEVEAATAYASQAQIATSIATKFAANAQQYSDSVTSGDAGASVGTIVAIQPTVALATLTFPSVASSAGWTPTGGTAQAVLADSNDGTYLDSPVTPSSVALDLVMPAIETPQGDLTVTVRASRPSGSSSSIIGTLRDNSNNLIATAATVNPTGSAGDLTVTFAQADLADVTQAMWRAGNLKIRLSATAA